MNYLNDEEENEILRALLRGSFENTLDVIAQILRKRDKRSQEDFEKQLATLRTLIKKNKQAALDFITDFIGVEEEKEETGKAEFPNGN